MNKGRAIAFALAAALLLSTGSIATTATDAECGPTMTVGSKAEEKKKQAGEAAVEEIQSGMIVGLGTGSTVRYVVEALAERLRNGRLKDIKAIVTSVQTQRLAQALGIPLIELDGVVRIDVTIDGADEIDPQFNLIKGGGGALLREKIVAEASRRFIVVADDSKWVETLGTTRPLPVEVVSFAWREHAAYLRSLGADVKLRSDAAGAPFVTDQGNYIIDCRFPPIRDAGALATEIRKHAGVVEHGLFLAMATDVFLASETGVRHRKRP